MENGLGGETKMRYTAFKVQPLSLKDENLMLLKRLHIFEEKRADH
jgi:hypothetical protein